MFLIRTLHKWFGLILGLQFVLWSVSGAMMALLDHHKVSAEHSVREAPALIAPAAALPLADLADRVGAPILKLRLRPLGEAYVYEATTASGAKLFDAATGEALAIDGPRAAALAAAGFSGEEPVADVRLVTEGDVESRALPLPLWRVEFADPDRTTLLLSATTGEVLERRNDTWRLFDIFWMIHIMDYTERQSFNHPLIITVATGVAWLAMSGLILLFQSFRRADFAWMLDAWEKLRARAKPAERKG